MMEGEVGVSLTHNSRELVRSQGGVTLGLEQGEPGADFRHLGKFAAARLLPDSRG